jgi:hypothetical protein
MNATTKTEAEVLELAPLTEHPAKPLAVQQAGSLAVNSPAAMMLQAMAQGASLEQVEKMMDLQDRWERREAEKAFNEALAGFKAEAVEVLKRKSVEFTTRDGDTTSYKHAELSDVVDAVGPALSKHGFSYRWDVTQAKGEISVTCILKHTKGHSETVTMSAPPDASGKKNAIQQIASATSYLQRYTLKAITGVAEKGQDDDGNGSVPPPDSDIVLDAWRAEAMKGEKALRAYYVKHTPTDEFWSAHKQALKDAARKADAEATK